MNTETGQIYDMQKKVDRLAKEEAEARGEQVVPVSEKVAEQQLAGQIAMSRTQRRMKRRASNNRKKR